MLVVWENVNQNREQWSDPYFNYSRTCQTCQVIQLKNLYTTKGHIEFDGSNPSQKSLIMFPTMNHLLPVCKYLRTGEPRSWFWEGNVPFLSDLGFQLFNSFWSCLPFFSCHGASNIFRWSEVWTAGQHPDSYYEAML